MSSHSGERGYQSPRRPPNLGVPPPILAPTKSPAPESGLTMSITHRLNTGGSVQALTILDDDCLIAGLQGGNILVGGGCPFTLFPNSVVVSSE